MSALLLLGIDTSGIAASAALCDENTILAETSAVTKLTHSQTIMPMCERLLESAGVTLPDVDGIVCAKGPGSYTGLRIGISAVKAMCYALGKKCLGVSALEAAAYNFNGLDEPDSAVCALIHARQELYYNAVFDMRGRNITRVREDRIISGADIYAEIKDKYAAVYVTGDCAEDFCGKYVTSENIFPAPPQLRTIKASGLCFAAFGKELVTAEELCADYLQPVKAEKDLEDKKHE